MDLAVISAIVAILGGGGVVGWWRSTRQTRDRAEAGWDAILGKAAVSDRAGTQLEPAQPGLVHRVAQVEEAVIDLRNLVAGQTALEKRVDRHDERLNGHDQTIAFLIGDKFEKGAEAALKATEGTIDGEPT